MCWSEIIVAGKALYEPGACCMMKLTVISWRRKQATLLQPIHYRGLNLRHLWSVYEESFDDMVSDWTERLLTKYDVDEWWLLVELVRHSQ